MKVSFKLDRVGFSPCEQAASMVGGVAGVWEDHDPVVGGWIDDQHRQVEDRFLAAAGRDDLIHPQAHAEPALDVARDGLPQGDGASYSWVLRDDGYGVDDRLPNRCGRGFDGITGSEVEEVQPPGTDLLFLPIEGFLRVDLELLQQGIQAHVRLFTRNVADCTAGL